MSRRDRMSEADYQEYRCLKLVASKIWPDWDIVSPALYGCRGQVRFADGVIWQVNSWSGELSC